MISSVILWNSIALVCGVFGGGLSYILYRKGCKIAHTLEPTLPDSIDKFGKVLGEVVLCIGIFLSGTICYLLIHNGIGVGGIIARVLMVVLFLGLAFACGYTDAKTSEFLFLYSIVLLCIELGTLVGMTVFGKCVLEVKPLIIVSLLFICMGLIKAYTIGDMYFQLSALCMEQIVFPSSFGLAISCMGVIIATLIGIIEVVLFKRKKVELVEGGKKVYIRFTLELAIGHSIASLVGLLVLCFFYNH